MVGPPTLLFFTPDGNEIPDSRIIGYVDAKLFIKKFNVIISESQIIVTSGASEALLFTIGSIMDPGDEIIIPEAEKMQVLLNLDLELTCFYHLIVKLMLN